MIWRDAPAALAFAALAGFGAVQCAAAQAQTADPRKRILARSGPGTLVLVTHDANIPPLTGIQPAEGEMAVAMPDAAHDFRVVGRIAPGN